MAFCQLTLTRVAVVAALAYFCYNMLTFYTIFFPPQCQPNQIQRCILPAHTKDKSLEVSRPVHSAPRGIICACVDAWLTIIRGANHVHVYHYIMINNGIRVYGCICRMMSVLLNLMKLKGRFHTQFSVWKFRFVKLCIRLLSSFGGYALCYVSNEQLSFLCYSCGCSPPLSRPSAEMQRHWTWYLERRTFSETPSSKCKYNLCHFQ